MRTHGFRMAPVSALAAGLLLFSAQLLAQPRMPSAEERADTLKAQLQLTQAQRDSVVAIYKAADEQRRAAFESAQGDRSAMREKMTAIRDDTDKKIEALLTPEQQKLYADVKKEREARFRNRMRPGQ